MSYSQLAFGRDDFARELQKKGIGISVHFIPLFHFSYWRALNPDFTKENYLNAENNYRNTISLPLWPDMTDKMIDEVVDAVIRTGKENHV